MLYWIVFIFSGDSFYPFPCCIRLYLDLWAGCHMSKSSHIILFSKLWKGFSIWLNKLTLFSLGNNQNWFRITFLWIYLYKKIKGFYALLKWHIFTLTMLYCENELNWVVLKLLVIFLYLYSVVYFNSGARFMLVALKKLNVRNEKFRLLMKFIFFLIPFFF